MVCCYALVSMTDSLLCNANICIDLYNPFHTDPARFLLSMEWIDDPATNKGPLNTEKLHCGNVELGPEWSQRLYDTLSQAW